MMALVLLALGAVSSRCKRPLGVSAAIVGCTAAAVFAHVERRTPACVHADNTDLLQAIRRQEPWTRYVTVAWGAQVGWPPSASFFSCPQAAWSWRRRVEAIPSFADAAEQGRRLCAAAPRGRAHRPSGWSTPRLRWSPPAAGPLDPSHDVALYLPAQGAAQACVDATVTVADDVRFGLLAGDDATLASAASGAPFLLEQQVLVGQARGEAVPAGASLQLACTLSLDDRGARSCVATVRQAPPMPRHLRVCGPALLPMGDAATAFSWHDKEP